MRASDFDFPLPTANIAQAPLSRRDEARLYVLDRGTGAVEHRQVRELPSLLPAGALLVVNDTRVIKARLSAGKPTGGKVELLLVEPLDAAGGWRCLGGASKPIRLGPLVLAGASAPSAEVVAVDGRYVDVRFGGDILAYAEAHGDVPLPPYIKRAQPDASDGERYQTVFARSPAPSPRRPRACTLRPSSWPRSRRAGIHRATVTLHVGPGTFAPLGDGELAAEHAARRALRDPRGDRARHRRDPRRATAGRRRRHHRRAHPRSRRRRRRSGPGGAGRAPPSSSAPAIASARSTSCSPTSTCPNRRSLMLVSAFAGRERVLAAYDDAVARGYRFYSYGDAMLLR